MSNVIHVDFSKKKQTLETKKPDKLSSEKLDYFLDLLDRGKTQTLVNSDSPTVRVPGHLKKNPALLISWSYKFGLPDFEIDEFGVRGTLTFKGEPFHVDLPWVDVWMIYRPEDGIDSRRIWKQSAPSELSSLILD